MSIEKTPNKLAMFDIETSRDEYNIPSVEKNKEEFIYNPSVLLRRDALKKFHTVKPIMTDKLKQTILEDKRHGTKQTIKTEGCLKISPIQPNSKEVKCTEGNSKVEKILVLKNDSTNTNVKQLSEYKQVILKIIESNYTLVIMTIITLFALFASDIESGFCPTTVDFSVDIIQSMIMILFTFEIVLSSICKEDYLWSFFFWLDLIATLSIIQDISFIFDKIMGVETFYSPVKDYSSLTNLTEFSDSKNRYNAQSAVQQFSSASRATRVLRIVRIIRLIRILKLYKNAVIARSNIGKKNKKNINYVIEEMSIEETESNQLSKDIEGGIKSKNESQGICLGEKEKFDVKSPSVRSVSISKTKGSNFWKRSTIDSLPVSPRQKRKSFFQINKTQILPVEEILKESKISKILSESITRKIITLIIGMLIILPIISDDFYQDDSLDGYNILSKYIEDYWHANSDNFSEFNISYIPVEIIQKYLNNSINPDFPIVSISIDSYLFYSNSSWINYHFRNFESKKAISDNGYVQIVYSNKKETSLSAQLNIGKTLFVCILLGLSAIYFEKDARQLVLQPLEVMIEIVDTVSKDPINANDMKKLKSGLKSTMEKYNKKGNKNNIRHHDNFEMKVIEKAILKISALLAIGFGEAGGEIIKENLSTGSELNPLIKGKKKTAIFGFCDIRNFSLINEALQESTIVFVNRIAEIVHSCVEKHGGAANKNIGEAFLMVWKFKKDEESGNNLPNLTLKPFSQNDNLFEMDPNNIIVRNTADMSVLGFLSVLKKLNKEESILDYRKDKKILEKIYDFKVEMGFGLHLGWAIEGAIGSSYKIDASYLSPNVNISARLEAATRQYGVSILISGTLYDQLSVNLKDICRLIDIVKLKGSNIAMKLYTIDVNLDLKKKRKKKQKNLTEKAKKQIHIKKKNKMRNLAKTTENIAAIILNKKSYVDLLTTGRNYNFYLKWEEGFDFYIAGKWKEAEQKFEECLVYFPADGPCINLLNYIRSNDCKAPDKWQGYRILLSK